MVPRYLIAIRRLSLFSANEGISGIELWGTDGTAAGITLLKNIGPDGYNVGSGAVGSFTKLGDWRTFFQAGFNDARIDGLMAGAVGCLAVVSARDQAA